MKTERTFLIVWAALILLTGITVYVAGLHLGRVSIAAALSIATLKATLVSMYFMRLRHEGRALQFMVIIPVITISVIIGFTFFDISFR